MSQIRPDRGRERRYLRLIKALKEAIAAMEAVSEHEQIRSSDDSRVRLKRDMDEYASYLDSVSWWRSGTRLND